MDTTGSHVGTALNGSAHTSQRLDVMRKRSVVIAGHRTSVSLETAFWQSLKDIAERRGLSVNRLVESIDSARATNLSSAIRVYVLQALRERIATSSTGADI